MTGRIPLIAANWKMNPAPAELEQSIDAYLPKENVEVVVFPSLLDIDLTLDMMIVTGAQGARAEDSGAYTGDISVMMAKDVGCQWVLCGHSERRKFHGETDEMVAAQATRGLALGLNVMVCVGETGEERDAGRAMETVERQVRPLPSGIVIAYEPVWAIGTGKTASPEQAQEMHAFIRSLLPESDRETTRILYGGSVTAQTADALLQQPDIDGALVGGASLKPQEFTSIVESALKAKL